MRFAQQFRSAVAETQAAVNAASEGDLTQRVTVEGKTGELATLTKSVNSLIDLVTMLVLIASARGGVPPAALGKRHANDGLPLGA